MVSDLLESPNWSTIIQVGSLVVATAAGMFAGIQVLQARRSREEQSRPYVIVDLDFIRSAVMVSVSNIGATAATDIRIRFDRPLTSPSGIEVSRFEVFDRPIPMLAPGRRLRIKLGEGPDFFNETVERAPVPLRYEASATYRTLDGQQTFRDPATILDLAPYKNTPIPVDELHEIRQQLKRLNERLATWTDSGRLDVKAITQEQYDAQWDH